MGCAAAGIFAKHSPNPSNINYCKRILAHAAFMEEQAKDLTFDCCIILSVDDDPACAATNTIQACAVDHVAPVVRVLCRQAQCTTIKISD